jgi:cytochrome c-type biogenesis protein CcmH
MKWLHCFALLLGLAGTSPAGAVQPDEVLSDQALETRARTLSRELRCMVCQNQSIDDSDAPLARDLRILVRERLKSGDSDAQVLDFLTSRYGEFVLLRPSLSRHNALLWIAPAVLLIAGAAGLILASRRSRATSIDAAPLSADEERRIQDVINR